jgi:alkylation response protein AidB-like acyl-CoA dehydrogenase
MDFTYRDVDLAVFDEVKRFAESELAPGAAATDEESRFAVEHVPALARLGLMGMNLPERWGGPGVSPIALFLAVQALAAACASTTSMLTAHFLATDAILIGGGDELRQRYLPPAAAGKALGAFALTEPKAGSNPADMGTRAVRRGDGYHLQGVKHFISNAGAADFLVVFALTDPAAGARGISAFVVERGTPGLAVGQPERTMGLRSRSSTTAASRSPRPASASPRRRWAPRAPGPRNARSAARRLAASKACNGCSPTWRPSWMPRACSR